MSWRALAACAGISDPWLFDDPITPVTGQLARGKRAVPKARAQAICDSCPVSDPCGKEGAANGEWGVWGGTTRRQRDDNFLGIQPHQPERTPMAAKKIDGLIRVPIDDLYPNPDNPRASLTDLDDLADSIKANGIIQPLVVMAHPDKPDAYTILAGHRRLAAAELAGLEVVPCVLRKGRTPAEALQLALVENNQRDDLDPIQEGRAIKRLMKTSNLSQSEVARRLGRSTVHVSQRLSLLELTPSMQRRIADGEVPISAGYAKAQAKRGTTGTRVSGHWFGRDHSLASEARGLCRSRHKPTTVRLLGGQACGRCWEDTIRTDAGQIT